MRSLFSKLQTELDTTENEIQKKSRSNIIHVRLQLSKQCSFGEQLLIVGNKPMFGLWDLSCTVSYVVQTTMCGQQNWMYSLEKLIQFKFMPKGK